MKVTWTNQTNTKKSFFTDLKVNDTFKIKSSKSKGAVYVKCEFQNRNDFWMMELGTGKIFSPTPSEVQLVDVEVVISDVKPQLYK